MAAEQQNPETWKLGIRCLKTEEKNNACAKMAPYIIFFQKSGKVLKFPLTCVI